MAVQLLVLMLDMMVVEMALPVIEMTVLCGGTDGTGGTGWWQWMVRLWYACEHVIMCQDRANIGHMLAPLGRHTASCPILITAPWCGCLHLNLHCQSSKIFKDEPFDLCLTTIHPITMNC